jgi:hypothetical protein
MSMSRTDILIDSILSKVNDEQLTAWAAELGTWVIKELMGSALSFLVIAIVVIAISNYRSWRRQKLLRQHNPIGYDQNLRAWLIKHGGLNDKHNPLA